MTDAGAQGKNWALRETGLQPVLNHLEKLHEAQLCLTTRSRNKTLCCTLKSTPTWASPARHHFAGS